MSGGKIWLGGTEYEVLKSKTMIGGTAYDVTKGKTLISSTAYDIQLNTNPALARLFADMSVIVADGVNNNQDGGTESLIVYKSQMPSTGTNYLFLINASDIVIHKCSGTVINSTPLNSLHVNSNFSMCIGTNSNGTYYMQMAGSAYGTGTAYSSWAGMLACVEFPNYSDTFVDALLSNMTITILDDNPSTTYTYPTVMISTNNTSKDVIICQRGADLDVRNGSEWTHIGGSSNFATISNNRLSFSCYTGVMVGLS